jgi:hypothetical protein
VAGRIRIRRLLAAVVMWPAVASAMLVPTPLPELVMQSDLIVRGEVIDLESSLNSDQSAIYTDVTLHVSDVVLSRLEKQVQLEITFRVAGGDIGGDEVRTSIDPVFEVGDDGIFLLSLDAAGDPLSLVGYSQGYFRIESGMVSFDGSKMPVDEFVSQIRAY